MSNVKGSKWYFVLGGLTVLAIIAGILISAIPSASARPTQANDSGTPRSITVVGTGSASASPNLATIQVGVDVADSSPETATRLNEEKMRSVIDTLKAAGVAEQDIQTMYYSMYAEQRYSPETNQPTGEYLYHVNSSVSAKMRDLEKVGTILSEAVKAGANNISGVTFSIENTTALQAAAREKAIADAKARAQDLARLSGVELGEVTIVSEVVGGPGPIFYDRGMGGGGGAPIQPGQLEVSMQLQVSFAIK